MPDTAVVLPGSDLIGTSYIPLFSSLTNNRGAFSIIPACHVTSDSGTGLVHCAPAHGADDYNAFRALGLISSTTNILCHVDGEGKYTDKVLDVLGGSVGSSLVGQEVLDAGSKSIVRVLGEIGALVKVERIKHRYPYDWKTDEPIIVMCAVWSSKFLFVHPHIFIY
jgi:isoleucyl-tRNA synthetase